MQIVSEKERKIKMDKKEFALNQHEKWNGKIEVISRAKIETPEDLAVAYTPGVAEPCLKIAKDVDLSYKYTRRGNLVAVVTDGTAVLGLGDIGPEAGMPVMEGKCALFKEFGDVDAFPLCIRSKDVDEIVNTVALLAGRFGGINLEDISAPRCFEIERKLKERCDIPVFHDDQHGTAVVTAAALLNALKFTGRKIEDIKVVMSGAGAAGSAIIKLLIELGLKNVIMCDRKGAIYEGREGLNEEKASTFEEWTPIGSESNRYTGTFDGNGKTISGIYINTDEDNQGLFGCIGDINKSGTGTVKNLGIEDSWISGGDNVGGIAGYTAGFTVCG